MPCYEGKKCRLRPLQPSDLNTSVAWRNDPAIRDFSLGFRFPVGLPMEEKWLNEVLSDRSGHRIIFAIEDRDDDSLVGILQLFKIDWISRTCFFGIKIGSESRQRKGIGGEATQLIVDLAFTYFNLRKITLTVASFNEPAIKIYERLGFQREGTLSRHVFYGKKYHDIFYYSKFRDDN